MGLSEGATCRQYYELEANPRYGLPMRFVPEGHMMILHQWTVLSIEKIAKPPSLD